MNGCLDQIAQSIDRFDRFFGNISKYRIEQIFVSAFWYFSIFGVPLQYEFKKAIERLGTPVKLKDLEVLIDFEIDTACIFKFQPVDNSVHANLVH